MFERSGRFISHHPIIVVIIWAAVAVAAGGVAIFGIGGPSIFSQLETNRPQVPGSDSQQAEDILTQSGASTVNLMVRQIDITEPATVQSAGALVAAARPELAALDYVSQINDPFQTPPADWPPDQPYNGQYWSTNGDGFVISVELMPPADRAAEKAASAAVADRLDQLGADVTAAVGGQFIVSSTDLVIAEMNDFMEAELFRAEQIALPAALIVLIIVFGGLLAALMPVIGAVAAIVTGLGGLILLNQVMAVDSVVVNVITIIGMGLSIDYGLLIVSRFREELGRLDFDRPVPRHDPVIQRVVNQVHATAGRTVTFSALTIAVCVLGLVFMKADLLRGIGIAGAMSVVLAMLAAVSLVPAVLGLVGHRFVRPSPLRRVPFVGRILQGLGDSSSDHGFFARLAAWSQRFRWPVFLVGVAALVAAASLVGNLQMRSSGYDLLTDDMAQSQYYDELDRSYPYLENADLYAVTTGPLDADQAAQVADQLAGVEHVDQVQGPVATDADGGHLIYSIGLDLADPSGKQAVETVKALRALDAPVLIWGDAASQLDFQQSLLDGLPLAGSLVVVAVFLLLFLMTGSVVVPLKALVTNVLSILASLGIASWIFTTQHGFAHDGMEVYVVALIVAFGFGLAMDYEVFLLDRIKEIHNRGFDTQTAIVRGLQRSGRIITSAASVIIVVFLGFTIGDLAPIREIGLTLAILVFIDATLVRLLVVPATMSIMGQANWWAPGPLKRLADRFAIRHVDPEAELTPSPATGVAAEVPESPTVASPK
ncbi:MAG: MMPL family transporter [Propionibacteriaceae bacterium]|nr:MMPL family transporter [Propionibacteriaceae bacterium]